MTSESAQLERMLSEAARLQGDERLAATLQHSKSWSGASTCRARVRLGAGTTGASRADRGDARLVAAELRVRRGPLRRRARLVDAILERDPFREAAHRLQMRIANAVGDEDRVIAAYRRCELTLGQLGIAPLPSSTRQLLDRCVGRRGQ